MTNTAKSFKSENSLERRRQLAGKIRVLYPDRLPVIVERGANSSVPDISKKKFLAPADMAVSKFFTEVKKQLQMVGDSSLAIFLFVDKTVLPPSALLMSQIYEKHKDEDGFLYITYSGENTFGSQ